MNKDSQRSVKRYLNQLQKAHCSKFTADAIGYVLGVNRYDVLEVLEGMLVSGELVKATPTLFKFSAAPSSPSQVR